MLQKKLFERNSSSGIEAKVLSDGSKKNEGFLPANTVPDVLFQEGCGEHLTLNPAELRFLLSEDGQFLSETDRPTSKV